jgi:hypothetical protein
MNATKVRTVRVILPVRKSGIIQINDGKPEDYHVSRVEGGFRLRKLETDGQTYNVAITDDGYSCQCKAFTYRKACRHGACLLALARNGKL